MSYNSASTVFTLCVTLLLLMFIGEPDLMDAIIKYIGAAK